LSKDDNVIDLGCSIGSMSRLLSTRVNQVTGIDTNQIFINYCDSKKSENEFYICGDMQTLGSHVVESVGGIWSSFSLSYLPDPHDFLSSLSESMKTTSWIALLDVSCFLSGNLNRDSKYYKQVNDFEIASANAGIYDFNFGSKMEPLLRETGFKIVYVDNNVSDPELNFSGPAQTAVLSGWRARLDRMQGLKLMLGEGYADFCSEFLSGLVSVHHEKRNSLRYVVAEKVG
jgi:SAM-dependent methyltransferase